MKFHQGCWLVFVNILLCFVFFVLFETGARLFSGVPLTEWRNFRRTHIDILRENFPFKYDARLGYRPVPEFSSRENFWGVQVSTNRLGLRTTGTLPDDLSQCVLVVGDSFTFGDQVEDACAWPAQLQAVLGQPVLNAGVSGYGLDQIVLYAEQLSAKIKPRLTVLAVIADDIDRCALSCRSAHKPYFVLSDSGGVELKNVPVPRTDIPAQPVRNFLGHFLVADLLFSKWAPFWWFERSGMIQVHHSREVLDELTRRLVSRTRRHFDQLGLEHCFVLLGRGQGRSIDSYIPGTRKVDEISRPLEEAALRNGIPLLNLQEEFNALIQSDSSLREAYVSGHYTCQGNAYVAERVGQFLMGLDN